ncbi:MULTISPECIES: ThiF family adenylyltransferase [Pseudomonas]|uniref:ThiF family adenylyltransferase n=1 Tax=Pseudomonas TaxID=286 RepID=UPI00191BA304|nr:MULTISPECIES: ThiF family adenylyltransferase [Pseudomonas]MCM3893358.1 ThiF family adenylyltransferase [Pseudomonas aeruginosa]MCM3944190.1 ThiF family adenylyltransferase [Pseudomonas aeruginosa]MCM3951177.1 ThiF family adenylyltransferase [Pseudomonas aeruginosa]MCM3962240.1 ThiF family adenylyltransferase [Pseudomonas aeruginosa]MCM3968392.1 ThiF family adenylyltransferase [Pseudomonas aeruginosa]
MNNGSRLVVTAGIYTALREHLFPGDGKEAAAILICTRTPGSALKLLSKELILVPYDECALRQPHAITWPGDYLEQAIDQALPQKRSIILVHSHPGGLFQFSQVDDDSDSGTMVSLYQGVEAIHGSAIMTPNGAMRARLYHNGGAPENIEMVTVPGDDICYWFPDGSDQQPPLAFTSGMTSRLSRLTAAVVGVSGTGSIVAEQLARLGFGRLILIDHDQVESKNLNRILNSTLEDAENCRPKVDVFADAVERIRGPNIVKAINDTVMSREAVLAVADADVLFCCVDSHQGRLICDLMASSFLLPLFDVGVTIPTRLSNKGIRRIHDVLGRIDYVQPGGSTLCAREVYTAQSLSAEELKNTDPKAHSEQVKQGYISGIPEEAPSVITLNMRAASACVNEFVARAFPFREDPNHKYARIRFSLSGGYEEYEAERDLPRSESPTLAQGDAEPLLGLPALGAA